MKVVSISIAPSKVTAFKPSQHFTRMRALPCEVVECYDTESVYKHGDSADVVLLPGAASSWPPFWNEVSTYVESLRGFVGVFSIDSYREVWPSGANKIRFDALFPLMYGAYKENAAKIGYECQQVFWSPCCVAVQDHNVERDIDIMVWGNNGLPTYPFRNFIVRDLTRYSAFERVHGELILNTLILGGQDYSYVRLPYHNTGYWGHLLYPLLERAKICCTGSANLFVPVPKHFENAACGCVTLTNDFGDREALGFEHGKNIWLTTEQNFIKDLAFLLQNEDLVSEMSANARQLIAERHTVKKRSSELYAFLQKVA